MYTRKKFHVSFSLHYPRNLNGHSHFLDHMSSHLNFRIGCWYMSVRLHLLIINSCLILEPLSNVPITMSIPYFPNFMRTHCSICSRTINSCLFVNSSRTSTSTTTGLAPGLTSSFTLSYLMSSFTLSGLTSIHTVDLENIFGCTISNTNHNRKKD